MGVWDIKEGVGKFVIEVAPVCDMLIVLEIDGEEDIEAEKEATDPVLEGVLEDNILWLIIPEDDVVIVFVSVVIIVVVDEKLVIPLVVCDKDVDAVEDGLDAVAKGVELLVRKGVAVVVYETLEVFVPRIVLVKLIEVEALFDTDGEGVSDFVLKAERLEEGDEEE